MKKKKAVRKTPYINYGALAKQMDAISAESGKDRTVCEARKHLITLLKAFLHLAMTYDAICRAHTVDPARHEAEQNLVDNIPGAFVSLLNEIIEDITLITGDEKGENYGC